jgi:hypothetical protein
MKKSLLWLAEQKTTLPKETFAIVAFPALNMVETLFLPTITRYVKFSYIIKF